MRPGRQDLNVIFFTFRLCRQLDGRQPPCRPLGGRPSPIFENFSIRHIFLNFFKYKNEKKTPKMPDTRLGRITVCTWREQKFGPGRRATKNLIGIEPEIYA